jgi:plastocyanin
LDRRLSALVAVGLVVVSLAGCGEKRSSGTQTGAASGGTSVSVSEKQYKLTPSIAKVSRAGAVTIQVQNTGSIPHALKIEAPGGGGTASTSEIQPGKSATLTVRLKKGTYVWFCPIDGHRKLGMKGTIAVAGGGSGGSVSGGSSGSPGGTPGGAQPGGPSY